MLMRKLLWLLTLSIVGSGRLGAFESDPNDDAYYAKGLEQKQSGNFSQALKTWLTGQIEEGSICDGPPGSSRLVIHNESRTDRHGSGQEHEPNDPIHSLHHVTP